jgi:hypothetical protein
MKFKDLVKMAEKEGCMEFELELSRFIVFDEKEEWSCFLDCPVAGFVADEESKNMRLMVWKPKDEKSKKFLKDNFNYKETKVNKCKTKKKK